MCEDLVADRVHQVRLAETDAAVDEQRVVGTAGILRDLEGSGARQLIALAFNEAVERERLVEPPADRRARPYLGLRGRRRRSRISAHGRAAADLDLDLRRAFDVTPPPGANLLEGMRLDPIDDEAVRREQLQQRPVLDELQRPNPRVELLLRELGFERARALHPKRRVNRRVLCHGSSRKKEGCGTVREWRPV